MKNFYVKLAKRLKVPALFAGMLFCAGGVALLGFESWLQYSDKNWLDLIACVVCMVGYIVFGVMCCRKLARIFENKIENQKNKKEVIV